MSAPFTELAFHYGVPVAAFAAALAGSGHCAGMCGPILFATRLTGLGQGIAYHGARIAVYAAFGAAAGGLGASLFSAQYGQSAAAVAAVLALSLLLAAALRPLLAWASPRLFKGLSLAKPSTGPFRPALVGAATALLPCGWLHLFVASAAATGDARRGALFMVAFGLGTIPGLALSERLFSKISPRLKPGLAALFLLIAVASSLALKMGPLLAPGSAPQAELSCH